MKRYVIPPTLMVVCVLAWVLPKHAAEVVLRALAILLGLALTLWLALSLWLKIKPE